MTKYIPKIDIQETQKAIESIKNTFQLLLFKELNMSRITAPLILQSDLKINDNLFDDSKGITFKPKNLNKQVEIVQSLAKWKRVALKKYSFEKYSGIFTDMNAIRPNDDIDYCHSLYVDQWDWEYIIDKEDVNLEYLKKFVNKFYKVLLITERFINSIYNNLEEKLPEEIFIISSKDLYDMFPNLSSKEREKEITKKHRAVFIHNIGLNIYENVPPHDFRALDYDNLELNGDLLVYDKIHDNSLELMSLGIRVDAQTLIKQKNKPKKELEETSNYYRMIINNELPQTIGGGLGQSRLCMFLLEKKHIGEVQVSVWDEKEIEELKKENIILL